MLAMLPMILILSGCSGTKPEPEVEPSVTLSPTITPTVPVEEVDAPVAQEYSEEALTKIADGLTLEILQGKFDQVNSYIQENLKATYTADILKQAFDDAVKPLGTFIGIDSVVSEETKEAIYIKVVLRYENNGLLLTYGFDSDIKLSTFYLNYHYLGHKVDDVASDLFTEIEITVGDDNEPLDGLLTIPKGVEHPPVVILVHGSGQNDMDETIGTVSNKPFRDLAHGLAEKGIASIRYNKRYYQYTDNIPANMTVYDEVLLDVSAAIDLAKEHVELDPTRIFVLGHSLGGMLSPKIALDNAEVAGIIALAGSPRNLEDIIYDQAVYFAEIDEESTEDEKELYLQSMQANVERVKTLSDSNLSEPILGCTGYYWKSLQEIDTKTIVLDLSLPMLFLQGSADFQVYPEVDFAMWKELLKDRENASFIEYDGLNHLFMPTTGVNDPSDYDVAANVSDQVIADIADWINKQ